ncbi:hypothetical protein Psuf_018280 [Phytohabitans suffuscus]|uniref:Glyoxalase/fosfomycin resistance/dioxygenase domain-containing protein n=1 Tax=Phytohabitans suffuscus TaxID=624315 RepID=A0A6F8YEH0_9ACTN|nr:hypothetical protein Psuf_018280 [Phytohabitans suffuscus]
MSTTQGIKTVLHPVTDLAAAKSVYTALLGFPPQTDESYYVGYEAGSQHVGLVPGGARAWPRRSPTGRCRTSRRSWPR